MPMSLRFEDDTRERLVRLQKAVAHSMGSDVLARKVSKSDIVRMAVAKGLVSMETQYASELAAVEAASTTAEVAALEPPPLEDSGPLGVVPLPAPSGPPNASTFDRLLGGDSDQ